LPAHLLHQPAHTHPRVRASRQVSISYLEIYNEQLYDGLDFTTQPHELSVHEDQVCVGGERHWEVQDLNLRHTRAAHECVPPLLLGL